MVTIQDAAINQVNTVVSLGKEITCGNLEPFAKAIVYGYKASSEVCYSTAFDTYAS